MQKRTLLISINIITGLSILAAALIFTQVLRSQLVENFTEEEQNHEMAFAETIASTLRLEMENNLTLFTQLVELPEIQSAGRKHGNEIRVARGSAFHWLYRQCV
jgi:hypothetical protein